MKGLGTYLAIAILAAMPIAGAEQMDLSKPMNGQAEKLQIKISTPFSQSPSEQRGKITRYGKMSSRPWTNIVGWHPGAPLSAYNNAEIHESQLQVLAIHF